MMVVGIRGAHLCNVLKFLKLARRLQPKAYVLPQGLPYHKELLILN